MTNVLTATASDIVTAALRLIGEVDANQPVPSAEMQDGLEALNYLVKSWQAQGLHLWTKTEGILFLDVGKTDYLLGPSGDEATTVPPRRRSACCHAGAPEAPASRSRPEDPPAAGAPGDRPHGNPQAPHRRA